jgi:hypothetical protein
MEIAEQVVSACAVENNLCAEFLTCLVQHFVDRFDEQTTGRAWWSEPLDFLQ